VPLQLWVSAIEVGLVFSLIALAYLVVLEGAGFFHFALGPIAMFSGLLAAYLTTEYELSLPVTVGAGVLAAVMITVASELLVVRPIQKRTAGAELPALVAVIAIMFAVEQLAGYLFGLRPLPGSAWIAGPPVEVGGAFISQHAFVLIGVTLAIFAGVAVWMRMASYGRMLRAVGDNHHAANLLGLPVGRIRIAAFALAGLIVGLAGPLAAAKSGINFHSGLGFALSGFLALVVGGTGSIWGPLAGGLLVALAQITASYYFGGGALDYVTLAVALVFFALRPQGLFRRRVRA
jgi:branched-chain amino acid transport system permease protein